jgi:hypothetical protein
MAVPGVSLELNFAQQIARANLVIQATPAQLQKAAVRAQRKTLQWVRTRIAREMAQALGVSQKAFKHRLSISTLGKGSEQVHILWFGSLPLSADALARPRQTRKGVTVGRRSWKGAFYRSVYNPEPNVWIRASRAADLGLDLPTWGGSGRPGDGKFLDHGGPNDSSQRGRFPLRRVGVAVEQQAAEIFRRFERRGQDRFESVLEQELNYVVNHERK